ncbi:MAG: adenylate/guanylate cyclase domain-containing protein [SAR324 cluster bacterium]|nr:adenylate/guanylate cyclase domain-containing protein [SAR324 cluster bacterium]
MAAGGKSGVTSPYPYDLIVDPATLAQFLGWTKEVYADLEACQGGKMSEQAFLSKYSATVAILILDMTGFTEAAMGKGSLFSFLRIYDVQKVCAPVFAKYGARRVRAFADDFTATFDSADSALDAAFEIHRRVRAFNESLEAGGSRAETCIGLGYGEIYQIGPDRAMGNEMNQTSKLGEDTAEGFETLITEAFYNEVKKRRDCRFEPRTNEDLPFHYYSVNSSA